jgi:hypothetical protein
MEISFISILLVHHFCDTAVVDTIVNKGILKVNGIGQRIPGTEKFVYPSQVIAFDFWHFANENPDPNCGIYVIL